MTQVKFHNAGAGPPLVLLHAFPLNAGMWEPQIRALKGTATLVVPDIPGFGASAGGPSFESLDELAAMLYEGLCRQGIEEATVAGCSMGGYVALALVRIAPRFARGLALINSKASRDSEQARANRIALAQRVEREGCKFLVAEWDRGALSQVTLAQRPDVVECVRSLVEEATPRGVIDAQRAMAARPDSTPLLATIKVPAVVIHGLDDRLISEADARSMTNMLHRAKFVGVPEAGHLPNLENPPFVSAALQELMTEVQRATC